MERHYIDDRVKSSLRDLEVNPPVEAWLAISEGMEKPPLRRFIPPFLRVAASLAALVVSLFSVWFLLFDRMDTGMVASRLPDPSYMSPQPVQAGLVSDNLPTLRTLLHRDHQGLPPAAPRNWLPEALPDYGPEELSSPVVHSGHSPGLSQPGINLAGPLIGREAFLPPEPQDERRGFLEYLGSIGENRPEGIRFGAHFAPTHNYRILVADEAFGMHQLPFESLEESILSFETGMHVQFSLPGRWSIQTGLQYRRTGQYVKDIMAYSHPANMPLYGLDRGDGFVFHPQSILTSQGSIRLSDPHFYFADVQSFRVMSNKQFVGDNDIRSLNKSAEGLTQIFNYVEVPVLFRYRLWNRYVGIELKAGIAGSYLLDNAVYLGRRTMQQAIGETYGVRQYNFSAIGGFSMEIPLSARLSLHLEPTAQVFLHPMLREGMMPGNAYPYSYSLQTGISYGW